MSTRTWCIGSGVPGDSAAVADGHYVGPEWASVAWHVQGNDMGRVYTSRPRCTLCIQTRGDYFKNLRRFLTKATNTFAAHARRYAKKWGCSVKEARRRLQEYGWTKEAITLLFEDAMARGKCSECPFAWDYGDHEMTLDVSDPAAPILANLSVICRTCNLRYGSKTLTERRQWRAYVEAMHRGSGPRQLRLIDAG